MKLYNNKNNITSDLEKFIRKCDIKMSKPLLNLFLKVTIAIIQGESTISADIANKLIENIKEDSIKKKIYRFFNNEKFNCEEFYNLFISQVINNMKFKHKKAYISIDHTFEKNEFVTIMFTLRVNKQGIPLYFRSAKTKEFCKSTQELNARKQVFSTEELKNGITSISNYFKNKNIELIFLADRWFVNLPLLDYINSLNHKYVVRIKKDSSMRILCKLKKTDSHCIWHNISDVNPKKYTGKYLRNIIFGKKQQLKANLVISMAKKTEEPWYLITNMEPESAVFSYSLRFGAIETLFKNTKSNGFRLEKSRIKNILAFENLYCILCFCIVWINVISLDYIKNSHHYKKKLHIKFERKNKNGKSERILSNFKLGYRILIKIILDTENIINFKIKTNFVMQI